MIDRAKLEEAIRIATDSFMFASGRKASMLDFDQACLLAEAARNHLATLPKTKMMETWHLEYAVVSGLPTPYRPCVDAFHSRGAAQMAADDLARPVNVHHYHCIRVTGPHQQEVPA